LKYARYKNYDSSEFAGIVEIINAARGKRVDDPESISGGGLTFYITLKDGTRHEFANKEIVLYTALYSDGGIRAMGDLQAYIEQPELLAEYPFAHLIKCRFEQGE
jgi:hypothetical protein